MRCSNTLIATTKEKPADAEVISHQLMLRAGLIRKLASGLYTWLPLGLRVLNKVTRIVREEMNKSGALEILMPVVQPTYLWKTSGRLNNYGPELLKFEDRHKRGFCLGPTHEEVITDLIRDHVQSYKQLPLNCYQIQTKFRDEIRPRFGVMRSREFIMKDAYSFHMKASCMGNTYDKMYQTYQNIFSALALDFRAVAADSGSIGGQHSHEFHVLAESGEDAIAFSDTGEFAANIELAPLAKPKRPPESVLNNLESVDTANATSIPEVAQLLNAEEKETVKTLIVHGSGYGDTEEDKEAPQFVALVLRGDQKLNEIKAEKLAQVKSPITFANEAQVIQATGVTPGSVGPIDLNIPVILDYSAAVLQNFICGANKEALHYKGANWERDVKSWQEADLRNIQEGDPSPDGKGHITIKRGIEVGHIFQLGLKYSEAMQATALNEEGKEKPLFMGCYGIGISRIVAAAIEQNHDEKGIKWPTALAPYRVALIGINVHKSEAVQSFCNSLYNKLTSDNVEVLYDDRKERPGFKFADMELIGIPHQIVVGDKSLAANEVEYRRRTDGYKAFIKLDQLDDFLSKLIK